MTDQVPVGSGGPSSNRDPGQGPVLAFPAAPRSTVAIAGSAERFPVRRIIAVGRNYAAHAREMGGDPDREPPFFFFKPPDSVVDDDALVPYPPLTDDFQFEAELVVAIGSQGFEVSPRLAQELVFGYAVGIDLTRRDLQMAAREAGRPWDWGKAFDKSAPCGPVHRARDVGHPTTGRIWLAVNDQVRQEAAISDLIWSVPEIVSIASHAMVLEPGDLIYTGTPAGVGPMIPGDRVVAGIDGLGEIHITIGPRASAPAPNG